MRSWNKVRLKDESMKWLDKMKTAYERKNNLTRLVKIKFTCANESEWMKWRHKTVDEK